MPKCPSGLRAKIRDAVCGVLAGLSFWTLCVTCAGEDSPGTPARRGLRIAEQGKALATIVVNSSEAIPAEKTAAKELADYLAKITGATFATVEESDWKGGAPAIYVGNTTFARHLGINVKALQTEESLLKTTVGDLVLTGGRPRGTLYAVYEFLENMLGVRWYTPWAEKVPRIENCAIPSLDRRVRPYFRFRSHYTSLGDPRFFSHEPWKWFNARNRLNQPSTSELDESVGGWLKCGGRIGGGHGFIGYLPNEKYFASHPEYFSMRDGKRVPGSHQGNHLCLTNPDVLRIVIEEVKKDIHTDPDGLCYTVACNDGGGETICDCPHCREMARKYGATDKTGTDAGLLLSFVNQVADAIREEYPDKFIRTLAYNNTGLPPKNIRARDNVIVQVCTGPCSGNVWYPLGNQCDGLKTLRKWTYFASHIWLWDYAAPCFYNGKFFCPRTWKMDEQMKFFRFLKSPDGIFQENELLAFEDSLFPQFYEMDMWIYARLCQNPDADVNGLVADFLNGYYGAAGSALQKHVEEIHSRLPRFQYRFFDYAFMDAAQKLFDQAEAAVKNDIERLGRVRDLRLQLDLAALVWRNTIIRDYLAKGRRLETYPYRAAFLKARLLDTLKTTKHPYLLGNTSRFDVKDRKAVEPVLDIVRHYVAEMSAGVEYTPLPREFASLSPDRVIEFTAPLIGGSYFPIVVPDPDAALGLAAMPPSQTSGKDIPMPIGFWRSVKKPPLSDGGTVFIQAKDVLGRGYHWYKGPRFRLSEWTYIYLTGSWQMQKHLFSLNDPLNPDQEWEVHVSAKFTGAKYPHGNPKEPNGLFFDRMILVRVENPRSGDEGRGQKAAMSAPGR